MRNSIKNIQRGSLLLLVDLCVNNRVDIYICSLCDPVSFLTVFILMWQWNQYQSSE